MPSSRQIFFRPAICPVRPDLFLFSRMPSLIPTPCATTLPDIFLFKFSLLARASRAGPFGMVIAVCLDGFTFSEQKEGI
jgi:hypothetical protein